MLLFARGKGNIYLFFIKIFFIGFDNAIAVDCVGRSGGLAVLRKRVVSFSLLQFSTHHIHGEILVRVEGESSYKKCYVTTIYGNPEASRREEVWKIIHVLKCLGDTPWLLLGDFNEILMWYVKWGGHDWSKNQIKAFRDMLADYALSDLGYSAYPFTCCNNWEIPNRIMEWLDCFLANPQWQVLYLNEGVVHGLAAYRITA